MLFPGGAIQVVVVISLDIIDGLGNGRFGLVKHGRCFSLGGPKVNPADEQLAREFETRDENTQTAGDEEMADRRPDLQPRSLIPHHVEEVQRHDVRDRHDHHEQRTGRHLQPAVQDPQVRADDGERDEELEDQQRPLAERVEDGDQAVDAVQREGRDRGDVAGAEKGRLEQVEEEQRHSGVGYGKSTIRERLTANGRLRGRTRRWLGPALICFLLFWSSRLCRCCGLVVDVDSVLQPHPGDHGHTEYKVKEPLIGNGENDKGRRECEEDHHQPVQIVAIWIQTVGEWEQQRGH